MSWNDFHTIARAKIAEAQGDLDGALTIVEPMGAGGHAPLVDTLLAELLRRGGEAGGAERCAKGTDSSTPQPLPRHQHEPDGGAAGPREQGRGPSTRADRACGVSGRAPVGPAPFYRAEGGNRGAVD